MLYEENYVSSSICGELFSIYINRSKIRWYYNDTFIFYVLIFNEFNEFNMTRILRNEINWNSMGREALSCGSGRYFRHLARTYDYALHAPSDSKLY